MNPLSQLTDSEILDWINARTPPDSYYNHELERLLGFVVGLPDNAKVVEIGVYGGRTAAVYFLEARRGHKLDIHLIDCWVLNQSDSRPCFDGIFKDVGVLYHPHWKPSQEAAGEIEGPIDLLHIDGDHRQGAWDDCRLYLPKTKIGSLAIVHDYGKPDEYPEVSKAVNFYFSNIPGQLREGMGRWEMLGVVGSQFAARRIE